MPWIILAILAALIWSAVNIIDKFIISHELRDPILATVVFGIVSFILFGIVSLIFGNIFLSLTTIIIAIAVGVFYTIGGLFYYVELRKEEVSRFIPILSTIPIFVLIFAFIFLGERFAALTYLGIILIVLGAILVSIKKITYKVGFSATFLIAIGAALFFALRDVLTKVATLQASIWSILFWVGIGSGLVSIFLFSLHHPHIRKQAELGIKHLILVAALGVTAFFIFIMAILNGPVSLVSALVGVRSLFVFIAATVLSIYWPKILKEKITKSILLQKIIAIILVIIGAILVVA